MGWGVLGCRPNTTGLRVAGGMPDKPKRIRGCYKKVHFFVTSLATPPRAPEAVRLLQPNAPQPLTLLRPFILGGLLPVGIEPPT